MRKITCITPVKNEEWIIRAFISSAKNWADKIIIADQASTDSTLKEIPKPRKSLEIISNKSTKLNESSRKNLLLKHARKIPKSIIFSLDSDEFLTCKKINNKIKRKLEKLPCGTMIAMDWCNISPDLKHYWKVDRKVFGYVDDGSSLSEKGQIHLNRVPRSSGKIYYLRDISVIHLQYIDWERMKSKHKWYVYWEKINYPQKSSIVIYRQYNHMYSIKTYEQRRIPRVWLRTVFHHPYTLEMLKNRSIMCGYWWEKEVTKMINSYGRELFFSVDPDLLNLNYFKNRSLSLLLKQTIYRTIFEYLRISQAYYPNRFINLIDYTLTKARIFS